MAAVTNELEGRVAIITGGGSGMGRAAALSLAASGASVTVADNNLQAARGVVEQIGANALAIEADVSEPKANQDMVERAVDRFGRVDLAFLNAGAALNEAKIQLEINRFRLRSFLGYNENVDIDLIIPVEIPELEVDVARALEQAHANNPTIIDLQRQMLEADASVAEAKAERGLTADLFASFGLTQQSPELAQVYTATQDQERLRIGLEVPIIDWGLAKGRHRMAQSNQEVTRVNVKQDEIDFDQEVMLQVMQFNLQDDQLRIAAKADTVAQLRYNVTKQRFYIGKIDVLDLNVALRERDDATRNYLSAMQNYWVYYFHIRQLTLYDFERDFLLTEDYETLVE